jgi:hypothetical protein
MKKTLLLSTLIIGSAVSGMAQGYFDANNSSTVTPVQVQDPTKNGGVAVTIGKPAVTAGITSAGPGLVNISLYAAANGTSLQTLESSTALITVQNSVSGLASFQGTFAAGNPFTLPTSTAFNGSSPIEVIFYGITSDGKYAGWSQEATGFTPSVAGSGAPAQSIFGSSAGLINTFVLTPVPEPTTIALGGFGAAALLYFRRRK